MGMYGGRNTVSSVLTRDTFFKNLLQIERTGRCVPDRTFSEADRKIAALLLWWYEKHPQALPSTMDDLSELPWHTLKAIGHLMFSQEQDVVSMRRSYLLAHAQRIFEPWEDAFGVSKKNPWEYAFDVGMNLMHEIEEKEKSEGDVLQAFFNFQLLHEVVIPLPRSCPDAFPAREFNDLVWMNWKARELFRAQIGLCPDKNGKETIFLQEQKRSDQGITALYIVRRGYEAVGDVIAAFGGYDNNPVGDLTGMAWAHDMYEKQVPVLALAGFFLDTFRPESYNLPLGALKGMPKDPLI